MQPRIVEVRQGILKKNDLLAAELRRRYREAGVFVVNLVSGPGAGKTELLEKTLAALGARARVAALVGDLATERDAERLRRSGAPVEQIVTGTVCHLDAEMVARSLDGFDLAALDFLFVENVGNLVCPAAWDLGERAKVVLFSVTEGEDKPLKYPRMFREARYAVMTKIDLLPHLSFDLARAIRAMRDVNPELELFTTSGTTGQGMESWLAFLRREVAGASTARGALRG